MSLSSHAGDGAANLCHEGTVVDHPGAADTH
jgi:hypothetical protein